MKRVETLNKAQEERRDPGGKQGHQPGWRTTTGPKDGPSEADTVTYLYM
jgi:hypothetical protein